MKKTKMQSTVLPRTNWLDFLKRRSSKKGTSVQVCHKASNGVYRKLQIEPSAIQPKKPTAVHHPAEGRLTARTRLGFWDAAPWQHVYGKDFLTEWQIPPALHAASPCFLWHARCLERTNRNMVPDSNTLSSEERTTQHSLLSALTCFLCCMLHTSSRSR